MRPKVQGPEPEQTMRTTFFLVFYYFVFVYPWWRLVSKLFPGYDWSALALGVLLAGPAALWVISRRCKAPFRYYLARVVYIWLGSSWLLACLSLLFEPVYLLAPFDDASIATVMLGILSALLITTFINANRFEVKTVRLTSPKLSKPLRALQLSDVHVGSRSSWFLDRVVAASRKLEPDIVFITGDLIDGHGVPKAELQSLASLGAHTCFAIGNHERYVDCDEICDRLEQLGIQVLRNRTDRVKVGDVELCVTGIDDADDPQQVGKMLASMDPAWESMRELYSVLLYHRPDGLEDAAERKFDLMLCGHTHNGQLVPFNTMVKRRFPRIKGLYTVDPTTMYVSVGTGTWGPSMRLGSVNELTVFEFAPG